MLLTRSARVSADLGELFDKMTQTLITKRIEPLVTMPFSGRVYYSCPFIDQIGQESKKRGFRESPGCPSVLLSPHYEAAYLPPPHGQVQFSLTEC